MTLTTLERVELTLSEPEIECDRRGCSNAAKWVVRGVCGCIDLTCTHHMTMVIDGIRKVLPCIFYCSKHPEFPERYCTKLADFVESVRPL